MAISAIRPDIKAGPTLRKENPFKTDLSPVSSSSDWANEKEKMSIKDAYTRCIKVFFMITTLGINGLNYKIFKISKLFRS